MACAAQRRGDQFHCAVCALTWDAGDPSPPACKREREGSRDVTLTATEVKGLKLASQAWLSKCRGGYRARGLPKVSNKTAFALIELHMVFRSRFGALKATSYGEAWLARHSNQRPVSK